jgi:hypothetical protein
MGLRHPISRVLKSELPLCATDVATGMRAGRRRRGTGRTVQRAFMPSRRKRSTDSRDSGMRRRPGVGRAQSARRPPPYPNDISAFGSANPIEPPNPACPNASSDRMTLLSRPRASRQLSMLFMNPNENHVGIRRTASRPVAEETAAILAAALGANASFPPAFQHRPSTSPHALDVVEGKHRHAAPSARRRRNAPGQRVPGSGAPGQRRRPAG